MGHGVQTGSSETLKGCASGESLSQTSTPAFAGACQEKPGLQAKSHELMSSVETAALAGVAGSAAPHSEQRKLAKAAAKVESVSVTTGPNHGAAQRTSTFAAPDALGVTRTFVRGRTVILMKFSSVGETSAS